MTQGDDGDPWDGLSTSVFCVMSRMGGRWMLETAGWRSPRMILSTSPCCVELICTLASGTVPNPAATTGSRGWRDRFMACPSHQFGHCALTQLTQQPHRPASPFKAHPKARHGHQPQELALPPGCSPGVRVTQQRWGTSLITPSAEWC